MIKIKVRLFGLGGGEFIRYCSSDEGANRRGKEKRGVSVFKVDYEKSYEFVSWEFNLYMLGRMEFLLGGWSLMKRGDNGLKNVYNKV